MTKLAQASMYLDYGHQILYKSIVPFNRFSILTKCCQKFRYQQILICFLCALTVLILREWCLLAFHILDVAYRDDFYWFWCKINGSYWTRLFVKMTEKQTGRERKRTHRNHKTNKKAQLSLTNPRDAKACQNCSNSTCLQRCRWQYWPIFMRLTAIASEIREIPRNSLKIQTYGVQGHPRSSILVSIESPYVTWYHSVAR